MRKIAELRERGSLRRAVSPAHKGAEVDDTNLGLKYALEEPSTVGNALATYFQKTLKASSRYSNQPVSEDIANDNLCKRCRELQLASFTGLTTKATITKIANIPRSSVCDDCNLCIQFVEFFKSFPSLGLEAIERQEFSLYYRRLERDDQIASSNDIYFKIHFENSTLNIRLVPTHGSLDRIHIVSPNRPDFGFVRESLNTCRQSHGLCERPFARVNILRLIDCKTKRLVLAEPDQPYVCLSYVWGKKSVKDAKFDSKLPDIVPKTVEDAMSVAVSLDIPYLWVDRYCIDQENSQEKHDIIRNMDRIYQGAEITIIAVAGDNPHHGLPGVGGSPRKQQLGLQIGGRTFLAAEEVAGQINESKWNERGWTYQECLLSRRRLVFTDSQIYFQCTIMHCVESLPISMTGPGGPFGNRYRVFPHRGIGHTAPDLMLRLREYYQRQLSFKSDIVHAFSGIINAFNDSKYFHNHATHFYGIPVIYNDEDLDMARRSFLTNLAWVINLSQCQDCGLPKRTDRFPSWAWASAKADRPDNALGELEQDDHLRKSDPWNQEDIEVCVTHRTCGRMNVDVFALHEDGYENFFPYIDLSSWVLEFHVNPGRQHINILGDIIYLEDASACSNTVLYVVYIGAYQDRLTSSVFPKGLVVQEAGAGLFRRVGIWSHMPAFHQVGKSKSFQELLDIYWKRTMQQGAKEARRYKTFPTSIDWMRNGSSRWQRRTLRIV